MKTPERKAQARDRRESDARGAHLTPHEHVPEHDLQPVEEVVADDNDGGAARGPALPRADGLYAGGGSWEAGEEPGQGLAPGWGGRLAGPAGSGAEPGVLTFGGVQAARPAAVLGVVVHKHVVRHGQHVSVHAHGRGHHHLRGEPRPAWLEPWDWGRGGAPRRKLVGHQQLEAGGWMLECRVTDTGNSFSPSGLVEGEPAGSGDIPRSPISDCPGKLTPGAGKVKSWGRGDGGGRGGGGGGEGEGRGTVSLGGTATVFADTQ